jgi:hypothetical protein
MSCLTLFIIRTFLWSFFVASYKRENFITGSAKNFRLPKDSVVKLNWKTLLRVPLSLRQETKLGWWIGCRLTTLHEFATHILQVRRKTPCARNAGRRRNLPVVCIGNTLVWFCVLRPEWYERGPSQDDSGCSVAIRELWVIKTPPPSPMSTWTLIRSTQADGMCLSSL